MAEGVISGDVTHLQLVRFMIANVHRHVYMGLNLLLDKQTSQVWRLIAYIV